MKTTYMKPEVEKVMVAGQTLLDETIGIGSYGGHLGDEEAKEFDFSGEENGEDGIVIRDLWDD